MDDWKSNSSSKTWEKENQDPSSWDKEDKSSLFPPKSM